MKKIFFFKDYVENDAGRLVSDLVLFFKKALKSNLKFLISIDFSSRWLGHTRRTNCTKFQTVDWELCSSSVLKRRI